ncbi:MAG: 2-hydroxyacyl-CoA dehydratase family protein [Planctomycetota bacterium]
MKTVAITSAFVPPEWVSAHGFEPRTVVPQAPEDNGLARSEGVCSFARGELTEALAHPEHDAVILASTCDQMRRGAELFSPTTKAVLALHIPATWRTPAALQGYIEELQRLGRFLVRLGGRSPSPERLANEMRRHDTLRASLRALRGSLSPGEFARALIAYQRGNPLPDGRDAPFTVKGPAIALVGCPLTLRELRLFDSVEHAGGYVALNATELGELSLPAPFDRRALSSDPFGELATRYFGTIPGVFRRPNSELYLTLGTLFRERDIAGCLFIRYLWCDLWHAELARLTEWACLPVLDLHLSGREDSTARLSTRIEAFLEILR